MRHWGLIDKVTVKQRLEQVQSAAGGRGGRGGCWREGGGLCGWSRESEGPIGEDPRGH